MTDAPRRIEYMPVAELVPATRNAKDHDQQALARSVETFGFVDPVVLDERTGRLLAGHGRTEWAQQAEADGAEPPDGIVVENGRWLAPVVRGVASSDDQHADAMGIALNRVGERGGWKPDTLAEMLDEIIGTPLADAVGFSPADLDDLIASTLPPPPPTFMPGDSDEEAQPRMDVRTPIVCPSCGHHFHRA